MLRFPLILALIVTLSACAETDSTSLAVTAETSMATLNAENDVFGLVVRYHEATRRAEAYQAIVQTEQARVEALRAQLEEVRPKVAAAQAALTKAEEDKAAAEAAEKAAAEAAAASAKKMEEATAAAAANAESLKELTDKQKETAAAVAAAQATIANGAKEADALTKERERLEQRLNGLRDRVALLRSAQGGHEKQLADIEKSIQSLLGNKDGR